MKSKEESQESKPCGSLAYTKVEVILKFVGWDGYHAQEVAQDNPLRSTSDGCLPPSSILIQDTFTDQVPFTSEGKDWKFSLEWIPAEDDGRWAKSNLSTVLGNLVLAVGFTYLTLTGQLGWLLDALVSIWLLAVLLPIVGLGAFFWFAGRDIVQSSCPNCGNSFQIFKSAMKDGVQFCPFCTQPFKVQGNKFERESTKFSSKRSAAAKQAFNGPSPRYEEGLRSTISNFFFLGTILASNRLIGPSMEVKLWNDKREREMFDSFADLYAIIKTTEKLEKAYVRDLVSSTEYESGALSSLLSSRPFHPPCATLSPPSSGSPKPTGWIALPLSTDSSSLASPPRSSTAHLPPPPPLLPLPPWQSAWRISSPRWIPSN
ncbi:hypothetical protein HPP92_001809 [Vanilla planifolia]|uniref:Uncharacterized protein n=1 Tax=Vanilla planifolia TaxID=51239 RepID=A0A835S460_VANPL|nr:hypothetical protein HPP92_001809 [Vanilla planifolia]